MTSWKITYCQGGMLYERIVMGDLYSAVNCGVYSGDIIKIEKVAIPS